MKSRGAFSERLAAKTIDVGIDQAFVGPLTLMLGAVGGWIFSSPESTYAIKVAYSCAVLLLICFWILCLFVSFASDRVRLYWWSLGVFSGRSATYRQVHLLCEYVSRLRSLCSSSGNSNAESSVVFGDVLWWFEYNLKILYVVYRVRGYELAGNGVGMDDKEMIEACRTLKKCWVQIDRLLDGEPEGALKCVVRYSSLSEGTRAIAANCLRQVELMRQASEKGTRV